MLQGHSFNNKKSIFNKSFIYKPTKQDKIDFEPALKSIDVPEENFMNFFTSNQTKIYLKLREMYNLSLQNKFNINKYFSNKEYSNTNQTKNNRLRRFIFETSDTIMSDTDLLGMVKYKNIEDQEFQLFVKYDSVNNKANVYLIDIYHLVIPTEFRQIHQKSKNPEEYYSKMRLRLKDNTCGLETIKISEPTIQTTKN